MRNPKQEERVETVKQGRETSLDLLKFLATCVIIMHHFQQLADVFYEGHLNFFYGNFYWGFLVELFFILSGYFAYGYALSEKKVPLGTFFWKKQRRFLPLLLLTGIAGIAVKWAIAQANGTEVTCELLPCIAGLFGFSHWFSEAIIFDNPTWYISVLLLCYVVFWLTDRIARKTGIHAAIVFLAVMGLGMAMHHVCDTYGLSMPLFSKSIGRGLFCFFWGLILRHILEGFCLCKKKIFVLVCGAYLVGFAAWYVGQTAYTSYDLYYLLCLTVFPCVLVLFKSAPVARLCRGSWASHLGVLSYHAFMWHAPLLMLLNQMLRRIGIGTGNIAIMYGCLLLCIAIGAVSAAAAGWLQKRKRLETGRP